MLQCNNVGTLPNTNQTVAETILATRVSHYTNQVSILLLTLTLTTRIIKRISTFFPLHVIAIQSQMSETVSVLHLEKKDVSLHGRWRKTSYQGM